jgi:hypothetical protein
LSDKITEKEWLWRRRKLLATAKRRAREKGIKFTIKLEDIAFPEDGLCPIFKEPLKAHKGKMERMTPSLDRHDSTLGYEPGNVRVISWFANYVKADLTPEQLQRLADYANGKL